MSLVTYEPKSLLEKFFENGDFFPKGFADPFLGTYAGDLRVNIAEEPDKFVMTASVPGWAEKDLDVEIKDGVLTLKGHAEEDKKEEKANYRMREFVRRSFERSFRLGEQIDAEKVNAKLENGILQVVLPKREEAKPKSVKVEIKK